MKLIVSKDNNTNIAEYNTLAADAEINPIAIYDLSYLILRKVSATRNAVVQCCAALLYGPV
jgi:hypothetical protein